MRNQRRPRNTDDTKTSFRDVAAIQAAGTFSPSAASAATGRETMTRTILSIAVAASLVLLSVEPSMGRNVAVACSAFVRNADGGWKVLAPVMLNLDGRLLGPMVGTSFAAGSTMNGFKMSEVLDRECR